MKHIIALLMAISVTGCIDAGPSQTSIYLKEIAALHKQEVDATFNLGVYLGATAVYMIDSGEIKCGAQKEIDCVHENALRLKKELQSRKATE